MKKLILIVVLGLFLSGCEKESKYLDVKVTDIIQSNDNYSVNFSVTNNSQMDIKAVIHFKIESDCQKGWYDTFKVIANTSEVHYFPLKCNPESVKCDNIKIVK